jgi:urease accessory protein
VTSLDLRDRWRIERGGALIHADDLKIDATALDTPAALNGARAMATVICIAADAADRLDAVRAALDERGGASAWNGKLVARLLAKDGLGLRKALIAVLGALAGGAVLPRIWTN